MGDFLRMAANLFALCVPPVFVLALCRVRSVAVQILGAGSAWLDLVYSAREFVGLARSCNRRGL
jgi:hypothetical protein